VTRRDGVMTSDGGEAASERGQGGDDASWSDTDLTRPKKKIEIHTVDSAAKNV
jgi:hypothetical protein